METGLAKKESKNHDQILFSPTRVEWHLVANLFWTEVADFWAHRDWGYVGGNRAHHEKVLSAIEISVLSSRAISSMGKLCNDTQCGDCGVKLKIVIVFLTVYPSPKETLKPR